MTHLRLASVLLIGLLGTGLPATSAAQTFNPIQASMPQPDLAASVVASSGVVGGGDQVIFTTTVSNPGVANNHRRRRHRDFLRPHQQSRAQRRGDRHAFTCTGGNIPAGGTATIRIFHFLMTTDDSRSTDATVDPQNAIRESNESNNHASASTRI